MVYSGIYTVIGGEKMKRKRKKKLFSLHRRFSLYNFTAAIIPVFLAIIITFVSVIALIKVLSPDESTTNHVNNGTNLVTTYLYQTNIRMLENSIKKSTDVKNSKFALNVINNLEKYGISLCIRCEDGTVFYISPGTQYEKFSQVCEEHGNPPSGFFYFDGAKTEISNILYLENGYMVEIILIGGHDLMFTPLLVKFFNVSDNTFIALLILFVILATITDVSLVRSLTKSVMAPVDNLNDAANKIKHGILDEPVKSDYGTIEFNQLCENFDDMRMKFAEQLSLRKEYDRNRRDTYLNLSHDTRTAITTIKGYTQGLIEGIANTPEKQHRYFNAIYNSTLSLEKLADSLSETVRFETDSIIFKFKERDMYKILNEWYDESKSALEERKIFISLKYFCNERVFCNIDVFQFERVVENLFSNSLKYKKPENDSVNISIICKESADGMFEMIYCDDGIGIKPEEGEKIFERFYRGDEARSNIHGGNGLGLTIVKQIIEHHSGTIKAVGQEGKGLELIIKIPVTRRL